MPALVEINREIMVTLVELLKQGGPLALWGLGIWLIVGVLKILVVSGVVYLVVRLISHTLITCYKINKGASVQRIHLLSQEVSKQLTDSLDNFSRESLAVVSELKKQLAELKGLLIKK
jgi:hypothetical protein